MMGERGRAVTMRPGRQEDVLALVTPGADLIVPSYCGEPQTVIDTLETHASDLEGVRVHQMDASRRRRYIDGAYPGRLEHVSYFLGPGSRDGYAAGTVELVPAHFSEVPLLLRQTTKHVIVLAAASPPDQHGYFSLGTNADYVASFIGEVPFFLEANPQMPRTYGGNQVHISQVAGWCTADYPLPEVRSAASDERDRRIAEFIAERVPDGACLQIGIGSVPNALLPTLRDHRHLGVHSELLVDGMVDLAEAGVLTGGHKHRRARNKHVATLCLGTRRLFDWIDDNLSVALLPVEWVNDPRVIAGEPNMISISATSEVDLMGQAASETIAGRYWSGSGGQADFARGALYSEGGMGFLVTHATTSSGISRITATLTPGSAVTSLKNTVDHVVTEYGVACLRGRSLSQRADALIRIAHPDHRDRLRRDARSAGFLH
ncbi:acetyl-CoA hydrolase/transferase family protein [Planotetraspora phitsanulokensis]|nr:acetyl-CoA hydrolase/transferase C-terminal domain-containing protein [Planotetraspora phitsanulokensis]